MYYFRSHGRTQYIETGPYVGVLFSEDSYKTIASESILFRYTVLGIRATADVTAPKVQRTRTGKAPPLLGDPIITRVLIPLGSRAWSF